MEHYDHHVHWTQDAQVSIVFCSWNGLPTVIGETEAWAFVRGAWTQIDSIDAEMNAPVVSRSVFKRRFRDLPKLPIRALQGEATAEVLRIKHRSEVA